MFTPCCLPILIGSLPLTDHREAVRRVLACTPQIPVWPQLPKIPGEGMLRQFLDGFPGLVDDRGRTWIDTERASFPAEMTSFYEDALGFADPTTPLPDQSRFSLVPVSANGFFVLRDTLADLYPAPLTVKGQVTGPVTCGIGIRDGHGRSIFAHDDLRDMLVRHLALKARWQVEQLHPWCGNTPPILFIDEPAMSSFGSAAFSSISRESVCSSMASMIAAIKDSGGLAGIHICANGDWSPALESDADIISFDAFSFFDSFILYREPLLGFLKRGGVLAWGIVPTGDPAAIDAASATNLLARWHDQVARLTALGYPADRLTAQTLIAPSCGTGSLIPEHAFRVLHLTATLSRLIKTAASTP